MEQLKRGERIDHYETERITKDGQRISVSVTISPIRNAAGRLVGASAIARDISERRQIEQEREELLVREQQARAISEAAVRVRDEFLSIASHELRSPLATVKGHAQMALRRLDRDGQLDPKRATEALRAIACQSDKLNRLIASFSTSRDWRSASCSWSARRLTSWRSSSRSFLTHGRAVTATLSPSLPHIPWKPRSTRCASSRC